MSDALEIRGVDPERLTWQDLALCNQNEELPVDSFYGRYEASRSWAMTIDAVCSSCQVQSQCLRSGVENKEWGCWGGVFLVKGKMDPARNAHKKPEDWAEIKRRTGYDFV